VEKPVPSPHATAIPSASRRTVVFVIAVVLAVHSFLVMLWVMPVNPIRDAVGQERLAAYINPYFEQSWSVFAPVPRRGGESIKVRAYIGEPGSKTGKLTDWYDITADEDQRIKYLDNPSRFHSATRRLGGNINSVVAEYNATQQRIVAANFVETPRSEMAKLLVKANTQGATGAYNNEKYVENDEMVTRFGTMYATARWGKGVTMVQFLIGHRTVPNYTKRKDINFLDVPFTYYKIGWRKAMPGNADAQSAFDDYVVKAPAQKPAARKVGE
jgi:hypothetical protein